MTKEQTELLTHIKALNLQAKRSHTSRLTEDMNYWSSLGINSLRSFEFQSMRADYSNAYKELYGFRPAMSRFKKVEDIEFELLSLERKLYRYRRSNISYEKAADTFFYASTYKQLS